LSDIAIVHDWLVNFRGGEKVLFEIAQIYPEAPIYTMFYDKKALPAWTQGFDIRPCFTNIVALRCRKVLLPFLPTLIESLDLDAFKLIISTSSCVAKGIIPAPAARHVCYLHSPMRYAWDQRQQYFPKKRLVSQLLLNYLRLWDSSANARVDRFLVNSQFVKQRVHRYYGRPSTVLHPPVDTDFFTLSKLPKSDYYVAVGAFVAYKRFDIAIEACKQLQKRLVIIGCGGEEQNRLKKLGGDVTFFQNLTPVALREHLGRAKALLFPGVEDFGIIAIEAMATGTPVIAFKAGGALDYVEDGKTGVYFASPRADSLSEAMTRAETISFSRDYIRASTEKFSKKAFQTAFKAFIAE
jgi:glycosyltransferase involved in cell wall biosynthesis